MSKKFVIVIVIIIVALIVALGIFWKFKPISPIGPTGPISPISPITEETPPPPPKELVSLNSHLDAIYFKDLEKIANNYNEAIELEWQGGKWTGKYQGKEKVLEFWKKFFANANFTSRDVRDFEVNETENTGKAAVILTRVENNKKEIISRRYQAEFAPDGKIIKEVWGKF